MTFAIFIKTWVNDYVWVRYLLRSIEKFVVPNFDFITIVTDEGYPLTDIPSEINGKPVEVKYVPLPENKVNWPNDESKQHPCPVGIGYVWAQCIKLNWDKYCNADTILQIDSDSMFTKPIDLFVSYKKNDKWKWWVRRWEDAEEGIIHKPAADRFIGENTRYDYMPQQSWIFTKELTQEFRSYVQEKYNCTIDSYILEKSVPYWLGTMQYKERLLNNWGSCEYELYGSFLDYVKHDEYEFVLLPDSQDYLPIKQSWSWGGLKEDDKVHREAVLS